MYRSVGDWVTSTAISARRHDKDQRAVGRISRRGFEGVACRGTDSNHHFWPEADSRRRQLLDRERATTVCFRSLPPPPALGRYRQIGSQRDGQLSLQSGRQAVNGPRAGHGRERERCPCVTAVFPAVRTTTMSILPGPNRLTSVVHPPSAPGASASYIDERQCSPGSVAQNRMCKGFFNAACCKELP
jgi:hypothetical protein